MGQRIPEKEIANFQFIGPIRNKQQQLYKRKKSAEDAFPKREGSPAVFVYRLYRGLWVVLIYGNLLSASKVFPQGRHKNAHIDWLCDMVVHSGVQRHLFIFGKAFAVIATMGIFAFLGSSIRRIFFAAS